MGAFGVDGRDEATWIIAAIILVWLMCTRWGRQGVTSVIRAALSPRLRALFIGLLAYAAALIWFTDRLGPWRPNLAMATVAWTFSVLLGGLFRATDVANGIRRFHTLLTGPFTVAALGAFVASQITFVWWIELILLMVVQLGAFVLLQASRGPVNAEHERSSPVMRWTAAAILGLLAWWAAATRSGGIDWKQALAELALAVTYTALSAPVLYALAVYFNITTTVTRIGHRREHRALRRRSCIALLVESRGRLSVLNRVDLKCRNKLASATTVSEARAIIRKRVNRKR